MLARLFRRVRWKANWLFLVLCCLSVCQRYLAVGLYVGIGTVGGFIWWYLSATNGPHITWEQLINFHECQVGTNPKLYSSIDCAIFHDARPSTVSLSILVTIEMFNALNALSENQSLLSTPPTSNVYVLIAVALSFALHFMIVYVPFLAGIFHVAPLNQEEWLHVLYASLPIFALDELLKFISRQVAGQIRRRKTRGRAPCGCLLASPLCWCPDLSSLPSRVCFCAKAAKQVAERKRLIKQLYGVEPDDLLLSSVEYRTNTGSFATNDPFRVPTAHVAHHHASSTHLALASALSRLSFYARTLLSHIPILRALSASQLTSASSASSSTAASQQQEEEEVMLKKV